MAPSSSPFTSSPDLPNSPSNPIVTFSSRPLQKTKEQHLLLARARRRRQQQRALRMSREKQIPALTRHCVSQFQAVPSYPQCFSMLKGSKHAEIETDTLQCCREASILSSSPGGAIVVYDGTGMMKTTTKKASRSFFECSSGDGDVSDVGSNRGPDLFELRNWQDTSSSSPSTSSYESPLNVSKAISECSYEGPLHVNACLPDNSNVPSSTAHRKIDDKEADLSAEYWKLQADVLAAECKLLRVEKELAIRKKHHDCGNDAVSCPFEQVLSAKIEPSSKEAKNKKDASNDASCVRQTHKSLAKEALQDATKKLHNLSYTSNCFTQEALRRLEEISHRSSCRRVPPEDPTEALQKSLQGLLIAARTSPHEPDSRTHPNSELRFRDAWEYTNQPGHGSATRETMANARCFAETAAFKKQLELMSLEFSESKDTAAYASRNCLSLLTEEKGVRCGKGADKFGGEELYCKSAIRLIVAQMQAENEQWSQVQDSLRSLQEEMEILIETRDSSEKRVAHAESQLLCLKRTVHDWRYRAQSAEEEVRMLQSEREALRLRIHNMKQKHEAEHQSWFEEGNAPLTDMQPRVVAVGDVEEQPRLANVGTQEDYALCESIVHSRNESSRSSVDLGTTSQMCIQRNIKKSLDFSISSNEGNTSKSRVRSHRFTDQIRKIEPTRLDFCSKTSDVNSGARHKISGLQSKVELTRLECMEPVSEYKERKKARLFTFKENRSMSGPIETRAPPADCILQRSSLGSSLGHAMSASTQDLLDHVFSSKSKSSFPSAPTSTPSRLPFGEIFNSPSSQ